MNDSRIRKAMFLAATVLAVGTTLFKYVENWSWIDSFYFAAITMSTIGYGDLTPTHDVSKLFTVFFGLFSVTMLFYVIGIAVEANFHKKIKEHIDSNKQ